VKDTPTVPIEQQSAALTTTLFSKLPPVLARALQWVAIPYWFDRPMLAALRGPEDADGRTSKIIQWLSQRSFVSRLGEDRYVLNTDVRGLIRARWTLDRQGFAEANRRLADYFSVRLAAGPGPQADEWKQAYLYHLLAADPDAGIAALQQAITEAEFSHRLAVAERLIQVAEEQRPFLEARHAAWLTYLQARSLQLHNRWDASCEILQSLLDQPDLPGADGLRPHVQALLANGLIETGHWSRAADLYRQALDTFKANHEPDQVASCQLGLGYAHMSLGLNIWGQRVSRPAPSPSLKQTLADLMTLPARLPILLYLLLSAQDPALWPDWLTLARGLDWTIARLFVQAAHWYRRALTHMETACNPQGILRAKDSLARLYLALGQPGVAARIYREIVDRTDIATSEYQMAHARAGLGLSLLRSGRLPQALQALQAAAPVLADYDDRTNAGRAFAALAEAQMTSGAATEALASYATALELLQKASDLKGATDVAHTLEAFTERAPTHTRRRERAEEGIDAQARQIASSVTTREYSTRYSHPALTVFRVASVAVLAVMMFVVLYLAIRTESGIEVRASAALIAQALTDPSSSMSPVLTTSANRLIVPTFRANIALGGLVAALLGYLIGYTLVGLYVLARTSLPQLEAHGRRRDVHLEAETVSIEPERMALAEVTTLAQDNWTVLGHPRGHGTLAHLWESLQLSAYSQTVLFDSRGQRIIISGQTAWYWPLTQAIARRIPTSARCVDLSTTLLTSPAGILFIANCLYLALFVALSYLWPDALNVPILLQRYALADLRVLIYLGLLIPLVMWLVIAPLHARLFLKPHSRMPWAVTGAGLGLACVSFINLGRLHFSLGHPDIIVSLLAVWMVWIGALAIYKVQRHPEHRLHDTALNPPVYPTVLRWGMIAVASIALVLAARLVFNELQSYDALLTGNVARNRADQMAASQDLDAARPVYAEAMQAYDLVLGLNPRDTTALAGQAAIHIQLREWDQAIHAYTTSLQINPRQPAVWANIGMAYEGQASELDASMKQLTTEESHRAIQPSVIAAYQEAICAYTRALDLVGGKNAQYLLQRGAVYSALGQQHSLQDSDEAWENYRLALKDMERVLELDPQNADAYNGIGWAYLKLAEVAESPEGAAQEYERAHENFEAAVHLAPQNANAYNGLAWTWLKLGDMATQDLPARYEAYRNSLHAYERASQLEPDDPQYMVSVGNARWLVSTESKACARSSASSAERAAYIALIQSAIQIMERGVSTATANICKQQYAATTDQAICPVQAQNMSLYPSAAHYYRELGQLAYLLYTCKEPEREQRLEQAIAYYDQAIALEPSNAGYWQFRGRITYILGTLQSDDAQGQQRRIELYQQAVQDLSSSLVIEPDNRESLNWRAFVSAQLARILPDDTAGWTRREELEQSAIADRLRMFELATDDPTRKNDAQLLAVAYLRLGWTDYLQGKYQAAIEMTDKGLAYHPDYPTLHFVKGLAQLALGEEASAQRSYEAGLEAARKLAQVDRVSFLDDAIRDLNDLGHQKPELRPATDRLVQLLRAAK